MAIAAPPRIPPPIDSAMHQPVELLIEEARRRTRRRRRTYAAGAAALLACAGIVAAVALNDAGPVRGQASSLVTPAAAATFGVFEPVRGRIVYPAGDHLLAVDPAHPSSVRSLALPTLVPNLVPAGWSADGTRLALTSEGELGMLVMDATGVLTTVSPGGACCNFVTNPWLAPDGTKDVDFFGGHRLLLRDLKSPKASRSIDLLSPPGVQNIGEPFAWSPDGTKLAVRLSVWGDALLSVGVLDVKTGDVQPLVPPVFGHIRQMAWSPTGSKLLVVAGRTDHPSVPSGRNPLVYPHEAGVHLVDMSGGVAGWGSPHQIASGYYVAATWSPDGAQIAAVDFNVRHRLIVMGADGSSSRVVVEDMASGLFTGLAWHPKPRQ